MATRVIVFLFFACAGLVAARAQPAPGDLFREYRYTNVDGDAGGAIRVGGKQGVSYPDRGSDFDYVNDWIDLPDAVDLQDAVRVEVIIEKILSHNGTHGLAIQWNNGQWIEVPEPAAIPEPRRDYYHHACLVVPVPLADVETGEGNRFRLRVSPEQDWKWPQHLIYGVHLRVYYDTKTKDFVHGTLAAPTGGETIGLNVRLAVDITEPIRRVNRVDYVGRYRGVNWEGDGVYRQWHYFYYHGELTHHLGAAFDAPWKQGWDTSWVPDQTEPIEIAAWITDDTGLTLMTAAATDLRLERSGVSVELCEPTDVPANWVTRSGAYKEGVEIHGDLSDATAARMVWSSWSPGYMNGLSVNGTQVINSEGPRYRYFDHRVDLPDVSVLKPGRNVIGTGKTPLHDGKMVHGMEVNWPGIQLLVRYKTTPDDDVSRPKR